MTKKADGIGRRIAHYRKALGFSNAKELAEKIGNPKISHAVISNIESGRRIDPSISEVIEIAKGLGISPLFLLAPVMRPTASIDLANTSAQISQTSSEEFLSWFMFESSDLTRRDSIQFDLYKTFRNTQLLLREQKRCQRIRDRRREQGLSSDEIDVKTDKAWIQYQDDLHDWYNLRATLSNNPLADISWVDDTLVDEIDVDFHPSKYPWLNQGPMRSAE